MSSQQIIMVDPATLHLPTSRYQGADPAKLWRQIAKHGKSLAGMPPLEAYVGTDGHIFVNDGVTRATRAAKLCPGVLIPVQVVGKVNYPVANRPTVKDKLP
jgi:hypothetical protein